MYTRLGGGMARGLDARRFHRTGFATGKISAFGVFDHSRRSSQITARIPSANLEHPKSGSTSRR
jgi:hypothetical protein